MTVPAEVGQRHALQKEERPPIHAMQGFDPFQQMDRMDEDAFAKELEGRVATELVYVVKDGGQEVVGLSKVGVDECCMALVTQGQVIREEDIQYELRGEGENEEVLFKCRAARFAVSPQGIEVRLDQVIGVKRQALYYEPAQELTLDSRVPGKKYKDKTFREILGTDEGRDYLGWMAENFRDDEIRAFVQRALNGEEARIQPGRRLNPHWYEHGAMKAARNARFRLIPGKVRASVIEMARRTGAVRTLENGNGIQETPTKPEKNASGDSAMKPNPYAPTQKQVEFYRQLADHPSITVEERQRALTWLAEKATRQTIKDQISWLRRTIDSRQGRTAEAAKAAGSEEPPLEMPEYLR